MTLGNSTYLRASILPAALTFAVTLAAALLLASGIESAQQQSVHRTAQESAAAARTAIGSELVLQTQALERLANKWALRPPGDRLGWDLDVQQVLANYPNLLAASWVEIEEAKGNFQLAWTHPYLYRSAVERLHSLVQKNRKVLLQNVLLSRQLAITETIHLADRGKAFAIYVPTEREGRVDGLVLGVFHLQILLDAVFERVLQQEYSVQLSDGFEVVYSRGEAKPDPSTWEHREELEILGGRLQVRIWPGPAKIAASRKFIDWLRWGGGALAVFLAGLVGLLSRSQVSKQEQAIASISHEEIFLPSLEAVLTGLEEAVLILAPPAKRQLRTRLEGQADLSGTADLGRILIASRACEALLGKGENELAGASLSMLLTKRFSETPGFQPLDFSSSQRQQGILRFAQSGEESLDLLCHAVRLEGEEGLLLCHLRLNEESATIVQPGVVLQSSPLAAVLLDPAGRVIYVNPAMERLSGYNERELLRTALPFALPEKAVLQKQPVAFHAIDKTGNPLDLDLFASVLGEDAASARTLLLLVDRTTATIEHRQLQEAERRYRSIVEATSVLLVLLDEEERIAYANPAFERSLGLNPQHIEGAPVSELLPGLKLRAGQTARVNLPGADGALQDFSVVVELVQDSRHKLITAQKSVAQPTPQETNLLQEIPDVVLVLDLAHRVQWLNRAAEDFYGITLSAVQGQSLTEALGAWMQVPGRASIWEKLEKSGTWRGEISSLSPQGREFVHDAIFHFLDDGEGIVAVWRDVTETKRAVDSFTAAQATETLNSLGQKDGMVDWNLRTQEIYLSPRWKEMLGFGPEELTSSTNPWYAVAHPADLPTLRAKVAQHLSGASEVLEADYRALHRSGEYRWMRIRGLATRNASGEAIRLVCLQTDIEEQKQSDEQLLFEAFHDSTTGLANRALLLERIAGSLGQRRPAGCVLFADLHRFSAVNEKLGTAGGDAALAEVARRLVAELPDRSFLARHGSDEFAALLPPLSQEAIEELSNRIRFALAKPFVWRRQECSFQLHLGFANLEPDLATEEQLSRASHAMAAAKHRGQPLAVYASSLQAIAEEKPDTSAAQEILEGIHDGEFRVFYHPVITLDTGEVAGLEALVRWQHPQRGLLAPKDFLPAAESTGAILALDRWVLREACAKAAELNSRFRRAETLVLTVNLSAQHFLARNWTSQLEEVILASDINPRYLRLELNNRGLGGQENLGTLRDNLQRIRVQVSIDDVDAGQASAVNWDGLPIDRVKLLPSLVRNLATARQRETVRGIIQEAESRGLQVVAGGVETLEQLAALRELRCHLAQGFYFAKPASATDTERLLARSPRW